MATNEIHREGFWLTLPVRDDAVAGDPVLFGSDEQRPGVVQVIHQEELPDIPGYIALPRVPNGNESGEDIDENLLPDGTVFASVALIGVWAFEIDGADTAEIGTPVFYVNADDSLALSAGDVLFGHVTNRGSDGRLHVLLAH